MPDPERPTPRRAATSLVFDPERARSGLGEGWPRADAGLYVHVPFCSAICPYCDFAVTRAGARDRELYLRALEREIGSWRSTARFDSVYLGGGTPSFLELSQLRTIRDRVRDRFRLAPSASWSLEANPEDVTAERVTAWRELGFEVLSLGLQSLDDAELRFLGRRHRAVDSRRSLELALGAGFRVVSADLIYGLPGQSEERWRQDLEVIAELGPQHLSCYELTIHAGTPFYVRRQQGRLPLPDQDARGRLFELTHRTLDELGYRGYEVSSFARAREHRSRHNQKYWRHVPYLGLGPAAHSFDGVRRWWNPRSWRDWRHRIESGSEPAEEGEGLSQQDLELETILLAMRTHGGLDLDLFALRFGRDLLRERGRVITELADGGLLRHDDHALRPTLRGLGVADELARRLS